MIKVNIVCVGKIKEAFYRDAVQEYAKRLGRFCAFAVKEVEECKTLEEEGEKILKLAKGEVIALCVEGAKEDSKAFAKRIKNLCDAGKEITFLIGSSTGLCPAVKSAADCKLSFSDMTFPHQLMRVVLCEQIYRAFMINAGSEYHK